MEILTEQIKIKKKIIQLRMVKTSDYRTFVEAGTVLEHILEIPKEDHKEILKYLSRAYFKTIEIGEERIKFVDLLALCPVVTKVENYEAYNWLATRVMGNPRKYHIHLFVDSMTALSSKIANLSIDSNRIAESNQAQQDLLHYIENNDLTDEEHIEASKKLKALRMKRRKLKNEYKRVALAKNFFDKHNIVASNVSELSNTLNGLTNVEKKKIYNERGTNTEHEEWKTALLDYKIATH